MTMFQGSLKMAANDNPIVEYKQSPRRGQLLATDLLLWRVLRNSLRLGRRGA